MTAPHPDLAGKAALVTGAAGGIGAAIASALVRSGVSVLLCDHDADRVTTTARSLAGADGCAAIACECDVADEVSVQAAVDQAADAFGRLDVVVNAAAVRGPALPAAQLRRADWAAVLDIGLTGVWQVSARATPLLAELGGSIVNIGSTAARLPRLGQVAYCVAKAGVEQLTRVLALELAADGVRVNAVCPGATETPLLAHAAQAEGKSALEFAEAVVEGDRASFRAGIPLRRLAQPADHAAATLFLASDAARHITGQSLFVDGGETML